MIQMASSRLLLILALSGSLVLIATARGGFHQHLKNSDGVDKFESSISDKDSLDHFSSFLQKHKKQYNDVSELSKRFNNFKANQERLASLTSSDQGSAKYGETKFSDFSAEEFKQKFTGYRSDLKKATSAIQLSASEIEHGRRHKRSIPGSLDYRKKGIVSSIKNQGQCGDCYAFASIAVAESVYALTFNVTPGDYSEAQITDCTYDYGNLGCNGGTGDGSFQYMLDHKSVTTEVSYPFSDTADHSTCLLQSDAPQVAQNLTAFLYYATQTNEDITATMLSTYGPLFISIDSSPLQLYQGGILAPPEPADGWNVDHAVALIGYGVDCDGTPYWIAKNSWGPDWGEAGFFRLIRGQNALDINDHPIAIQFNNVFLGSK